MGVMVHRQNLKQVSFVLLNVYFFRFFPLLSVDLVWIPVKFIWILILQQLVQTLVSTMKGYHY